jgi:cell division GTPase FtsZ
MMNRSEVTSKMNHHARLAYEAWNNGCLFDYHIENARFMMAVAQLWKMDLTLASIEKAVDSIVAPC